MELFAKRIILCRVMSASSLNPISLLLNPSHRGCESMQPLKASFFFRALGRKFRVRILLAGHRNCFLDLGTKSIPIRVHSATEQSQVVLNLLPHFSPIPHRMRTEIISTAAKQGGVDERI